MIEWTTIRVSTEVRDALVKMGKKREDYVILRRVLEMPPREEEG